MVPAELRSALKMSVRSVDVKFSSPTRMILTVGPTTARQVNELETRLPVPISVNRHSIRICSLARSRLKVTLPGGNEKLNHPFTVLDGPITIFDPKSQLPLSSRPPL